MLLESAIAKLIIKLEPKLYKLHMWKKTTSQCYKYNKRHYMGHFT